jgi:mono/diheme cytochrome c family protein
MDAKEKQEYLEKYHEAKEKGHPFFPDIIFKDTVVVLGVFLVLVGLAYFIGAPLEARANPADTSYTPRPEWYFLFLFQFLKYFPGNLEVIGAMIIPTLGVLVLLALPLLDRSSRRHFFGRPLVAGGTILGIAAITFLTIQSVREAPPPAEETQGDQTAALYAKNCAPCHGASISVPEGTNLHSVIAQGKHEGMPAWSGDLTTDQIDALAGFILSPAGSKLFTDNCGSCHEAPELVAGNPLELKNAMEQGPSYPAHEGLDVPQWTETLSQEQRTALLNFLVAPDGQRLFAINCSPCHGRSVAFSGDEAQLRTIISQGGLHLTMPPWRGKLNDDQLNTLAKYVVDPASVPQGQALFESNCSSCHGEKVPKATDIATARENIANGGAHQTMPVWGQALTPEQLDALVSYTMDASRGTPLAVGQQLFAKNCTPCHGDFGEGGPNPTRAGDIIAPISTSEFLKTRDDATLRAIISQGQPNFGMSPFGTANGGPLSEDEVDSIVAYIRSWEANPPVELPTEVAAGPVSLTGADIYAQVCAQCHGPNGEGAVGPSLRDPNFQDKNTDEDIFNIINGGHKATAMISWGEILTSEQIQELVKFIRQTRVDESEAPSGTPEAEAPPSTSPTYVKDIEPILSKCIPCHGSMGGWDASSYQAVMTTGDNGPVVIPGDPEGSLLVQKLLGTASEGKIMPPGGKLSDKVIQTVKDWIAAGALEK